MVFLRPKVAVFVDGCFWHRCPLHGVPPKNNQAFWKQKLDWKVMRDRQPTNELEKTGWLLIRFWKHEIEDRIDHALRRSLKLLGFVRKN
jgi:DNA mismatch endonuclease, patch repair protein